MALLLKDIGGLDTNLAKGIRVYLSFKETDQFKKWQEGCNTFRVSEASPTHSKDVVNYLTTTNDEVLDNQHLVLPKTAL